MTRPASANVLPVPALASSTVVERSAGSGPSRSNRSITTPTLRRLQQRQPQPAGERAQPGVLSADFLAGARRAEQLVQRERFCPRPARVRARRLRRRGSWWSSTCLVPLRPGPRRRGALRPTRTTSSAARGAARAGPRRKSPPGLAARRAARAAALEESRRDSIAALAAADAQRGPFASRAAEPPTPPTQSTPAARASQRAWNTSPTPCARRTPATPCR